MGSLEKIKKKLKEFIKKYYWNEILKGTILFLTVGLLYMLFILFIEHIFWLSVEYRTLLFWCFIGVELLFLVKWIGFPMLKLIGLKKGLSEGNAARIIGNHFSDVDDKLINLVQLEETLDNKEVSDLLFASIEQKANDLNPIPFRLAINFKKSFKFLKYLVIPVIIILMVYFTGNQVIIEDSYSRVINYSTQYLPPAPFQFEILNKELRVNENEQFVLTVKTEGSVIPNDMNIVIGDERYFLKKLAPNSFQFSFDPINENLDFQLESGDVLSKIYSLQCVRVPVINSINLKLIYPTYLNRATEVVKNTGDVEVPKGTSIEWNIETKNTEKLQVRLNDTVFALSKIGKVFNWNKKWYASSNYHLITSNKNLNRFEDLEFRVKVIKDEYPQINVKQVIDSLNNEIIYYGGQISDDHGIRRLCLVLKNSISNELKKVDLSFQAGVVSSFKTVFPGIIKLDKGVAYELYFEVIDNDVVSGYKSTRSKSFYYNSLSEEERSEKLLKKQKNGISNLSKSLKDVRSQEKDLNELFKEQRQKNELNWNDKNKINDFIKKQERQENLMRQFNKQLNHDLKEFNKEEKLDEFKKELLDRLKKQEEELKKNEKLLDELKSMFDKLRQEDLIKKMEELSKSDKMKERSLEQILELTKKYYLTQKFEKAVDQLNELAKKQKELSTKGEANTKEKQEELNKEFDKISKSLKEIKEENKELSRPYKMNNTEQESKMVKDLQKQASDDLGKKNKQEGTQKQKKAAEKMQDMLGKMQQAMSGASMMEMEEDIKTLRQILDNLLTYSFNQEKLLETIKSGDFNDSEFPKKIKKQFGLLENFEHIDDSLFALSLRQPMIGEKVNKEITEVHFNLKKALERFSDNKIYLGKSNQQYALTASNNLADMLSNMLNAMQNAMQMPSSGKGKGKGKGFQLPDIIQQQEELIKQMQDGKGDKKGGKQEGEKGDKAGQKGKQGKEGKGGEQGENGQQEGKNGKQGGQGSQDGEDGTKPGEENDAGKLYEIYKKQQEIKNALEDIIKSNPGLISTDMLRRAEQIENDLLERGFDAEVLKRMKELKHQLLKLDKASFEQGEENKRNSETNREKYKNSLNNDYPLIEDFFNEIEILNRQVLPLRLKYKQKVNEYFKKTDD